MSFGSGAYDRQRLLPEQLEARLIGHLGRMTGVAVLTAVVALWFSLISWNVADPSMTHATGGQVHNLLGSAGAITSDLLLQMLGFAAVVVVLAPMFWGLELLFAERVIGFRTKVTLFPISVLMAAAAFSALPVSDAWPLHHGYGGILGDLLINAGSDVFSIINPDRSFLAAGVLFALCAISTTSNSIGIELRQVWFSLRGPLSWHSRSESWHETMKEDQFVRGSRSTGITRSGTSDDDEQREPIRDRNLLSRLTDRLSASSAEPVKESRGQVVGATLAIEPAAHDAAAQLGLFDELRGPRPGPREPVGDDLGAKDLAKRFAPECAVAKTAPEPTLELKPRPILGMRPKSLETGYRRPSLNLLKRPAAAKPSPEFTQTALRGNARLLEDVLANFGVKGEVRDIKPGPVVTLFEFEPARGTKSSRVIALADDIAREMSATSVRAAVVPGRNAIGIELPNVRREPVLLRELLETEAFRAGSAALPMAIGKSIGGEPVVADLARMPHLLVAGTTGSGKSVGVNAMILSLIYRHSPETCRFVMIDPKMLELSVYNGIPHLLTPVITEPQKAVAALNWVVAEMEERYKRMSQLSVRNIDVFNNRVQNARKRGEMMTRTVQTGFDQHSGQAIYEQQALHMEPMPYIVVVVDEFADLMIVAGKEIEQAVQRLAQMARAAGIHLIMATQRPSVDIITGTIKANFPTRISFKVTSKIDSRTILNDQGAEQLLGQGDMLYASGSGQTVRVHGPFVSDEEVESIAQALREQGEPRYIDGIADAVASAGANPATGPQRAGSEEDLYDRAVAVVLRDRKASTSYVQRRLSIGYNKAADLIERMEREGLIGPANAVGKRDILASGSNAA